MSDRQEAYDILMQLNDDQLDYFISVFGCLVDGREIVDSKKTFDRLEKIIKPSLKFDYKKSLVEHREEKYEDYD